MLKIEVCEIKGKCPVHKMGDKIVIEGPKILLEETDAVCVHALSSMLHYTIALEENIDLRKLGLSKKETLHIFNVLTPESPTPTAEPLCLSVREFKNHEAI